MAFLLDTHALIWWWDRHERLSEAAHGIIADPKTEVFVSAASALEIAILVRLERLPTMAPHIHAFDESVSRDGLRHLPVNHEHAVRAGLLEGQHRDPFDRLLAAQGLLEGLTVLTRDREIAGFGCQVLW